MGDPVSTGNINITVLGGMFDGQIYTLPLDTRAVALSYDGTRAGQVQHVCVRGHDGRAYAIHPITGWNKLNALNLAWDAAIKAAGEGN